MENKDIDEISVKKSKAPLYFSLAMIAALVISYFAIPQINQFFGEAWSVLTSNDETRIKNWVSDFGWLGPVVIILAMIVQMFLLVIPSILLMVVSILAYGPILGGIIIFIAVFCASSLGFLIGKYLSVKITARLLGKGVTEKMTDFINNYGFWAVVITRLNPFLSNDAISFVGGLLRMNYWKFITATLLGITPLILLIAITGSNTDSLKSGLLWGSIVSLMVFGLYIWWDKRKKLKK